MINKDRLLRLAALLRQDAVNSTGAKFDLNIWGSTATTVTTPTLDCNTAACAVGVACLSGVFKNEGLDYSIQRGVYVNMIRPTYGKADDWEAVQAFFGLYYRQAVFLFAATSYDPIHSRGADGERSVAARIEGFVANDGSMDSSF